ncbi:hypothetical protein [Alloactinosynnema sp. L-07]|uniref:MarR family transcriptional regulator n=1 Tax=Alloactinosynnema sp. L-07 TaxID=1653480 RepID=UPI00065F0485|nr:MarR family transcriptional regulator [Alloactinosynnema sp. L-07]CRK57624.1 hypothetical protein [Alloactinosynnema sp. L-07]
MSTRTRTRTTTRAHTATTATGSARTLRPVPVPDTEDKLWKVLYANPNTTAADLSTTAGIGKSTAGKILARWANEGTVTRTAGIADGGRRAADLWTITPTDTTDTEPDTDTPDDIERDAVTQEGVDSADPMGNPDTPNTAQPAVDTPPTDASPDDSADPDPDAEPVATEPDTAAAENAPDTAAPEPAATAHVEHDAKAVEPTADGAGSAATGDGGAGVTAARLAPGALRGMVEDHLRDHPGAEFSPVQIARKLGGKSTGAVSNALDKLVEATIATQTKDRPRRYALAPDTTEAKPAIASA